MKIKRVVFPEALLNALRDGRLVVFAGAGVSMGEPSRLPSFRELAEQVAKGTGESIAAASETDDQFLGRLKDSGVRVHRRAAGILQPENLEPNALHRSLLRLFQKTGPVRIVTTNFDCLFEQAAETGGLFKNKPKVFEAPALPLGTLQDIVGGSTINWNKDQGNDVESPTWRHLLSNDCTNTNSHHLTMSKQRTEWEATQ